MKTLYLHSEPDSSSKANLLQVKAMCKAMSDSGMQVVLSLPADKGNSQRAESETGSYSLHFRDPVFHNSKIDKYLNYRGVRKAINEHEPDYMYLRTPLLLQQALASNKPIIMELHNVALHQGYRLIDAHWRRLLLRTAKSEQIKKIVCISQALSDYWVQQGIQASKVVTAHDGIDEEQFFKPMQPDLAKVALRLPKEKKIATYLGRLYENRRIDVIFALARIYNDVLFLVVGGPDSESRRLANLATQQNLDNILFTGQIAHEKITNYLYASDVLLALWSAEVKTINYCSPLKLFEYMASGKTIVAHGFPTILEVLRDGENAIIVEPDSLNDLVEKVGYAIRGNDLGQLGKTARDEALSNYTWQKRVARIFDGIN